MEDTSTKNEQIVKYLGKCQDKHQGLGGFSGFYRISGKKEILYVMREILHKRHSEDFLATIYCRRGSKYN